MTITLHDLAGEDDAVRFSPYCWRTRFCLLHKGLDFETVPWRFTERETLAPTGQWRVPVIVDHANGGKWIHDSWTIAGYLDTTYPDRPPLFPSTASRASGRLVAVWAETAVHAAAFPLILGNLFERLAAKDKPYFRQSREDRFGRTLEQLSVDPAAGVEALRKTLAPAEAALAVAPFLDGDAPGFADYALAGSLMWIWIASPVTPLDPQTSTGIWFQKMLDLFGGHARRAQLMR